MARRGRGRPPHPDILTPAEWRILEEVRTGATNAEIAVRLGLSPTTVKYHISNILGKLELRNRRQIATWQPERRPVRIGDLVGARVQAFLAPLALLPKPLVGTAVATVVTVAAIPAIILAVLLTRPDEPQNVLISPAATASPVAATTPTPTPPPDPTPDRTPVASPTPQPQPTQEPTPEPTSEATPEPTPEPPIDSTPNALGIRQVATDEAFTRLEYAPGKQIGENTGLFFLDVKTGAVEGWQHVDGLPIATSPDNRYVAVEGAIHDRDEDRTFIWDPALLRRGVWGDGGAVAFEILEGDGDGGPRRYVEVGPSMEPEAEFDLPVGWSIHAWRPEDGLLLSSGGVVRLGTGEALSFERPGGDVHVFPSGEGFATVLVPGGSLVAQTCHAIRYDWSGLTSEVAFPCIDDAMEGAGVRLSPNGRWIAATTRALNPGTDPMGFPVLATLSLFNAVTGEEVVRVRGATLATLLGATPWLAGGDALLVESVLGLQVLTVDGQWGRSPSRAIQGLWLRLAPDDPAVVGRYQTVSTLDGETLATANFEAEPSTWVGSWGRTSQEFRIRRHPGGIGLASISPTLLPAIQTPPFEDALTAEVVVDTCLNVREQATTESEIVVCLPPERVVELTAHPTDGYLVRGPCTEDDLYGNCVWVHVLTEDGEQGWAYADFLQWPGTPLVPDPAPPAPRG